MEKDQDILADDHGPLFSGLFAPADKAQHNDPKKKRKSGSQEPSLAQGLGVIEHGDTVHRVDVGGSEFSIYEIAIARALADAYRIPAKELLDQLDLIIARGGTITELVAAAEQSVPAFSVAFTPARPIVETQVELAIVRGANVLDAGLVVENTASTRLVQQGIASSVEQFANARFEGDTFGRIMADVDGILADVRIDPTSPDQIRAVREAIDRRLANLSTSYSNVSANAASNRAYNYGILRGGSATGFNVYTYSAITDAVTSDICLWMNGRQFFVADALAISERAAGSPSEVATIQPWPRPDDVLGLSTTALRNDTIIQPPLHGNCRSIVVMTGRR